MFQRRGVLLMGRQEKAQVIVGLDEIRLDCQGLLVMLDRLIVLPKLGEHLGELKLADGIVGSGRDGFLEVVEGTAKTGAGFSIVRLDLDRLAKLLDSFDRGPRFARANPKL